MHHFNDLLRPAAKQVVQLWIRTGLVKEPYFLQLPFIYIKGMKARIEAGKKNRKTAATCWPYLYYPENMGGRHGISPGKVCYRWIEPVVAGGIEVWKLSGNRIFILIPVAKAVGSTVVLLLSERPRLPTWFWIRPPIVGSCPERTDWTKKKKDKSKYVNLPEIRI